MKNATQTAKKLYPFSLTKHAHDVEYRYNRLKILEAEAFDNPSTMTRAELEKLQEELEQVKKAYLAIMHNSSDGRTAWVDGKTYGILKQCIMWADVERHNRNH